MESRIGKLLPSVQIIPDDSTVEHSENNIFNLEEFKNKND